MKTGRFLIARLSMFFLLLCGCFAFSSTALAQQRKVMPTVGWLWYGVAPTTTLPTVESAIIDGLRELGYVDGKNIRLEHRYAQGKPENFVELARDLAAQNVDVILTLGGDLAGAAKKAVTTFPIVFGMSEDPVRAGLVDSLARPGGNITGVSFLSDEFAGKRLEILKEINPQLARVGILWNPAHVDDEVRVIQKVADQLAVHIQSVEAPYPNDFRMAGVCRSRRDGILRAGPSNDGSTHGLLHRPNP